MMILYHQTSHKIPWFQIPNPTATLYYPEHARTRMWILSGLDPQLPLSIVWDDIRTQIGIRVQVRQCKLTVLV